MPLDDHDAAKLARQMKAAVDAIEQEQAAMVEMEKEADGSLPTNGKVTRRGIALASKFADLCEAANREEWDDDKVEAEFTLIIENNGGEFSCGNKLAHLIDFCQQTIQGVSTIHSKRITREIMGPDAGEAWRGE
jgi:cobalamin biosynthesis protein CobT